MPKIEIDVDGMFQSMREEDSVYLSLVRGMKCIVPHCEERKTDPHHVFAGGMGTKTSDYNVIPLCREHHRWLHDLGKETFRKQYLGGASYEELVEKVQAEVEEFVSIHGHPMTKREAEKASEEILSLYNSIGKNIVEMGKWLHEFRSRKGYKALGYPDFQNWYNSYNLSKTSVYRAMDIYENIVIKFSVPEEKVVEIGPSKLEKLTPLIKSGAINEENFEDAIISAESLGGPEFETFVEKIRGKKSNKRILREEEIVTPTGLYRLVPVSGATEIPEARRSLRTTATVIITKQGELYVEI
jgi:hypothetical protein